MELIQKYKRPLILVAIVVFAVIGWSLYAGTRYHVTRVSPDNKRYPASLSTMNIYFNRTLDSDELNRRATKDASSVIEGNFEGTIKVSAADDHLSLQFSQTPNVGSYELQLKDIVTTNGETLTQTLPFVTKDIAYDKLSKEEKALFDAMGSDAGDTEFSAYPVLAQLPHETDKYLISYRFPEGDPAPTLIITMKFFEPGSVAIPATPAEEQQYLADIRTYRTAALDWLKSQGVSYDKYSLEYTEPDLANEFPAGRGRYLTE